MSMADLLHPVAEVAWRSMFFAAGRLIRPRPGRFSPSGRDRVLVIAPHPDDEAIGCAGAIILHRRSGDEVGVAYVTDGSRSRAGGLDAAQMRSRREQEARAAAVRMGVSRFEWFGLEEGNWTFDRLTARLAALLRQLAPRIVYAPSRVDFHPEHRSVAHCLAKALANHAGEDPPLIVRVYQLQVPLTPVLTNLVVDGSSIRAETAAVIHIYASQSANLDRAFRQRRYTARLYGLASEGEEFWQIPAAQYCTLHAGEPDRWQTACFRGIRHRPFSDPLAYAAGFQERRRLRRFQNDV